VQHGRFGYRQEKETQAKCKEYASANENGYNIVKSVQHLLCGFEYLKFSFSGCKYRKYLRKSKGKGAGFFRYAFRGGAKNCVLKEIIYLCTSNQLK
jgi:hypothetical protein